MNQCEELPKPRRTFIHQDAARNNLLESPGKSLFDITLSKLIRADVFVFPKIIYVLCCATGTLNYEWLEFMK